MTNVQHISRWYLFQTRPNTEFVAERSLNTNKHTRHFETFVPSAMVDKLRMGVVIGQQQRAYFGSYGFVRFNIDVDHWKPITSTYGIKRLFTTPEYRPIPLPIGVVESLQQVMSAPLEPEQAIIVVPPPKPIEPPAIFPEDLGAVMDGPLLGYVGVVQSVDTHRGSVTMLMDILHSQVPVTFEIIHVRKVQTTESI